jgi:hypothetical protein
MSSSLRLLDPIFVYCFDILYDEELQDLVYVLGLPDGALVPLSEMPNGIRTPFAVHLFRDYYSD